MRALTVCQPWAHAIACCGKTIENRTWGTSYRGPLLIHAGLSRNFLTSSACLLVSLITEKKFPGDVAEATAMLRGNQEGAGGGFGCIVAVGELAEVVTRSAQWKLSPRERAWYDGVYGFRLKNVRALPRPVRASGGQGLWTPSEQLVAAVMDELEGKSGAGKELRGAEMGGGAEGSRERVAGGGLFGSQGRML